MTQGQDPALELASESATNGDYTEAQTYALVGVANALNAIANALDGVARALEDLSDQHEAD